MFCYSVCLERHEKTKRKAQASLQFLSDMRWSKFDVHGSVHRKRIFKYNQQDATLHSLFICVKCSTCFRRFLRPSSGAQNCIYSIGYLVKPLLLPATVLEELELQAVPTLPRQRQIAVTVWQVPDAVDTVVCATDDGWRYHPKHVEKFPDINKLCNVTSCWICIGIRSVDIITEFQDFLFRLIFRKERKITFITPSFGIIRDVLNL